MKWNMATFSLNHSHMEAQHGPIDLCNIMDAKKRIRYIGAGTGGGGGGQGEQRSHVWSGE